MLTRNEINGAMRYLTVRETPVPKESEELEEQGYTIVCKAFNVKELKALRTEINQVYDERQPASRKRDKPAMKTPQHYRYEMFNHSPLCQAIAGRREILDVIEPLLGEDCHIIANTCWRNCMACKIRYPKGCWTKIEFSIIDGCNKRIIWSN